MTQDANARSLFAENVGDMPVSTATPEPADASPRNSGDAYLTSGAKPWAMPFDRLLAWVSRGTASVLQQGLFAGAHFVTNVLLARWLAPASYGVFALAYSVFLLVLMLYVAVFFEPMVVFGAGRYAHAFSSYIRVLHRAHFIVLLPIALLAILIAPLLGRFYTHDFQVAFLWLAFVSPFLLLMWLRRAAFYAQLNTRAGALAGASYFLLLTLSVWLLQIRGALSPASTFVAMGVVSLLVSVGFLDRFGTHNRNIGVSLPLNFGRVLSDHWSYGRWAALTASATWIPANIYYALLPTRFGLESVASLRALFNLMYPLQHTVLALATLLIPVLVRQRDRSGVSCIKHTVLYLLAIFIPVGLFYLLLLVVFRSPILNFLYAGRYGTASVSAVIAIGILPITTGIAALLGAALRALERPRLIFWSYLVSVSVALSIGIPITLRGGVGGAVVSLVLGDLATVAVLAVLLATTAEGARSVWSLRRYFNFLGRNPK